MSLTLTNATCVTPCLTLADRTVLIEDGTISRIAGPEEEVSADGEVLNVGGNYVLPGLIDIHAHGAAGADFFDPDLPVQQAAELLHAHGVTGLYPTVDSRPWPRMKEALERGGQLCSQSAAKELFRGIHCEGPFLNPEMSGAAQVDALCQPTLEGWKELQASAGGQIELLTIAPELDGAGAVIRSAFREGVAVSAGHSNADYETTLRAVDEGLRQITHLFNGMSHFHHRDPNILLAALLEPDIRVQLNGEGGHVHPLGMRLTYRLKGAQGIILASDMHPAAGLGPGTYDSKDGRVESDGVLIRTADGTVAGSALPLDESLRTMVHDVGASLPDAARMATLNAAQELGLADRKGRVAEGYDADLAVLDGQVVYRRESNS